MMVRTLVRTLVVSDCYGEDQEKEKSDEDIVSERQDEAMEYIRY